MQRIEDDIGFHFHKPCGDVTIHVDARDLKTFSFESIRTSPSRRKAHGPF
jgi:hypothetical protein